MILLIKIQVNGDIMQKNLRKLLSIFIDYVLACLAVFVTLFANQKLNLIFGLEKSNLFVIVCGFVVFPVLFTGISYAFRSYSIIWEFANITSYIRLFISSVVASGGLYVAYSSVILGPKTPFTVPSCLIIAFLCFIFVFLKRYITRISEKKKKDIEDSELLGNVLVIGAGSAGNLIIGDIRKNIKNKKLKIVGILDDDDKKQGLLLSGVKVIGKTTDVISVAEKHDVNLIIFAIPSCSSAKKASILNLCQKTNCKVKIIPSYYQLAGGSSLTASSLRTVQIEDLLGRDPIDINVETVLSYVEDKVVLVTGGGGSIGSELCRQIATHKPKRLIIFDIYENNAYDIQNELLKNFPNLSLTVLIGSVRDEKRLAQIFDKYRPNLVYHAAAHKHVPLMENSPNESIKNNVFGTYNTAKCADKYGVERFILISTDKAVNPTNIMGASKRICEMVIQNFNKHSKTEFVAVRFGNVLGSNGSVIPLFKKQIEAGGPVTVTDPNIIRYFMTIPEAVSLVLQAGACAKGGEIFVLDMGEPVKIVNLAENLISLSGYKPYVDIKIEFTGLRPGEKVYEEKLLAEEGLQRTDNRLIHIGKPIEYDEEEFLATLSELKKSMVNDDSDIRALVKKIVPTFNYSK